MRHVASTRLWKLFVYQIAIHVFTPDSSKNQSICSRNSNCVTTVSSVMTLVYYIWGSWHAGPIYIFRVPSLFSSVPALYVWRLYIYTHKYAQTNLIGWCRMENKMRKYTNRMGINFGEQMHGVLSPPYKYHVMYLWKIIFPTAYTVSLLRDVTERKLGTWHWQDNS
jgi:hypothetical protein